MEKYKIYVRRMMQVRQERRVRLVRQDMYTFPTQAWGEQVEKY